MLSVLGKVQKGKRMAGSIKDWFKLGSPIRCVGGERGREGGAGAAAGEGSPSRCVGKGEREAAYRRESRRMPDQ